MKTIFFVCMVLTILLGSLVCVASAQEVVAATDESKATAPTGASLRGSITMNLPDHEEVTETAAPVSPAVPIAPAADEPDERNNGEAQLCIFYNPETAQVQFSWTNMHEQDVIYACQIVKQYAAQRILDSVGQ